MGIGDRINLNQIKSKISNLASSDPCHYIRDQFWCPRQTCRAWTRNNSSLLNIAS